MVGPPVETQAENSREQSGGRVIVAGGHDGVVQSDCHVGAVKVTGDLSRIAMVGQNWGSGPHQARFPTMGLAPSRLSGKLMSPARHIGRRRVSHRRIHFTDKTVYELSKVSTQVAAFTTSGNALAIHVVSTSIVGLRCS